MKTIILLLIFSFNTHAQKWSETFVKAQFLQTEKSFSSEEEALEEAFRLEDHLKDKKSDEYLHLKKSCMNFIGTLSPTVVRLIKTKDERFKGNVQIKIRCRR